MGNDETFIDYLHTMNVDTSDTYRLYMNTIRTNPRFALTFYAMRTNPQSVLTFYAKTYPEHYIAWQAKKRMLEQ